MKISVIICSHNPRTDYLERTLDAITKQTLSMERWELLVIDNGSKEPLDERWDLSWHPSGRHIREDTLGLTPARLRGIQESSGDLLVFVDDDNVLHDEFLANALGIATSHPWVGCFNGVIRGDYEVPPPLHLHRVLQNLAIREFDVPRWSCRPGLGSLEDAPCGAGMVVRRNVANHYAENVMCDDLRRQLDRKGGNLISCGDSDLALSSCELGLAVGMFPDLELCHLIPSSRLKDAYHLALAKGLSTSFHLLRYIREHTLPDAPSQRPCRSERLFQAYKRLRVWKRGPSFEERLELAREDGRQAALSLINASRAGKDREARV